MRIKLGFTFLVLFVSTIIKAQVASVTEGCSPLPVTFTPPAGTSPPYFWDFGNGASSPNANPTNAYNSPGTYTVVLKQGVGGAVLGSSIIVTVSSKPTFELTAGPSPKGCAPLNVSLTANITPPPGITVSTYSWGFGDNTGGETGNPKTHTYLTPGLYDVTLSINTSSVTCDTTRVFTSFISTSTKPTANFTTSPDPAISCTAPLTVSFTNTSTSSSAFTSSWSGPASTDTDLADQTYSSDGSYSVSLTVADTNGCTSNPVTKTIAVGAPTASFSMPDTVCVNTPVAIVNNSSLGGSGSYVWTRDAGVPLGSSFQPSLSFSTGGIHTVTLQATSPSGLCSDDTVVNVFVEDPQLTVTSVPTYSCSEPRDFQFTPVINASVATWAWTFESLSPPYKDLVLTGPVVNHTFVVPDSMYTKRGRDVFDNNLSIITTSGCISTFSWKDTIHLVWARFMPDTVQGCAPHTVVFSDSSKSNTPDEPIVNWAWNYGDGTPVANKTSKAPHPHTYAVAGEYEVVLIATNSAGCNDTSYATTIYVGDAKAIDFTADKLSVCLGEAVTFTHSTTDTAGIDGWNYSSDLEYLSHCFKDENPTLIFDDSVGLQDITLTVEYNGCFTSITKADYIDVKGPIAHFDYLITCGPAVYDVQFTDLSGDATSLSWDFGDGTPPVTTTGTFTHSYLASDDYNVVLTATNGGSGCADSKDMAIVNVKKIEANFSSDTTICIGEEYTFDASASIDVNSNCLRGYTWIFSDLTARPIMTSSPTSSIALDVAGNQTVGLIVQDINGCVDTVSRTIKVYSTPVLYTISDDIICTPDTIQFTDNSVGDTTIVKWEWSFGEGGLDSIQNPKYIYSSVPSGTSSVTTSLTLTDTIGCVSSLTKTISIYKLASVISTSPASPNVCLGDSIVFTASDFTAQGSSLSFLWDYQDGPLESGNNKTHTYAAAGAYTVKLYFSEIATGCNDSTTKSVSVQDYPIAAFSTDPDNSGVFCSPEFVTFSDTSVISAFSSPLTSVWDFGPLGTGTGNSTSQTYIDTDTYTVTLTTQTSNGCADTVSKSYLVVAPRGDFDMDLNSICKGDSITFTGKNFVDVVSFTWFFGDGDTSIVDPVTHTYNFLPPSGSTKAALIVKGQGGCVWPIEKTVGIHYVKADFTRNTTDLDTSLCLGDVLLLTNSSSNADIFSWNLGDGETSTTSTSINKQYDATGTYAIDLFVESTAYGCKDTTSKIVFVNPIPQVIAISDTACRGDSAQLSVNVYDSTYSYSWSPTTGLTDPLIYNPKLEGVVTTDYYVNAKVDSTGCYIIDTATVYVVQPLLDQSWDTTIVIGEFINLPIDNQGGLVNFTWTPTDGLSCLNCANPALQPLETINYSAFMEDVMNCFSATQTFDITVRPETFIKLPTTFTPNGDGFNDVIYVKGWGIKELITFEIYNRWGELVFKSTALSEGWDGYYKGLLQNNELYVYKVKALDFRDKEIISEGHINLMR